MSNCCFGSYYGKPWPVYNHEDAVECVDRAAGQIAACDSGSGCGATTVADAAPGQISTASLRRVIQLGGRSSFVSGLARINRRMSAHIAKALQVEGPFRRELIESLSIAERLGRELVENEDSSQSLSRNEFNLISLAAYDLAASSGDLNVIREVRAVVDQARHFIDVPLSEVRKELFKEFGKTDSSFEHQIVSRATHPVLADEDRLSKRAVRAAVSAAPHNYTEVLDVVKASARLQLRASSLDWLGSKRGNVKRVPGGFMQEYENGDLYTDADGPVFEVHGDIRKKYNQLGGAAALGLPITDETVTPDQRGRYNHFTQTASIYWTPTTGPFMIRGRVRQGWADQGWEAGALGYPVVDQCALPPFNATIDDPRLEWCVFENGAYLSDAGAGSTAVTTGVSPGDLSKLIRKFFADSFKTAYDQGNSDYEAGLHPQVEVLAVKPWEYGFFGSGERQITIKLHGFVSIPWSPADPEFTVTIRLRLHTTNDLSFTYPSTLTLCARLEYHDVNVSFPFETQKIYTAIWGGIWDAFWRGGPDPANTTVPNGSVFIANIPTGANQSGSGNLDVIDANLAQDGTLTVYLNPLPPQMGALRKLIADKQIEALLEG